MVHAMKRFLTYAVLIPSCMMAAAPLLHGEDVMSWKDCVMFAVENNPDLKSAFELVNQSRAGVGIARSAYLPQVSANASLNGSKQQNMSDIQSSKIRTNNAATAGQLNTTFLNSFINTTSTNTNNSYKYGISGTQLIFDSMKTIYDIKSAESSVDDARYQFIITAGQVRYNLRNAFVQLLKSQESIAISKDIAQRWKKNLDLVKMRYKAGREHRGSLMNAEASLAQAELGVLAAERSITVAQRSLLRQMGVPTLKPIRADGTLAVKTEDRTKPDFDAIVKSHPMVMQIVKQMEAARYAEDSKIASFFPVISAAASADQTNSFVSKNTTRSQINTISIPGVGNGVNLSASIQATMPLSTGGSDYYNLAKARSQSRKLKADEASTREQVVLNLEQYWINWQNAIDNVEVQRKFLAAAEERARIAEAEYSLGLVIFDNWIIIEDQLAQTKQNYLDTLANQLTAEAQWIQAQGETFTYDK